MCSFSAKVTCAFLHIRSNEYFSSQKKATLHSTFFIRLRFLGYRLLFLHGGSLEITLSIPLRIGERREYEIGLENGENIQVELKKKT